jgi:hypothetical protein
MLNYKRKDRQLSLPDHSLTSSNPISLFNCWQFMLFYACMQLKGLALVSDTFHKLAAVSAMIDEVGTWNIFRVNMISGFEIVTGIHTVS